MQFLIELIPLVERINRNKDMEQNGISFIAQDH